MKKLFIYLTIFSFFFACKKDGNFNSDPILFKEYISGFSNGLISAESGFKILLNKEISKENLQKIEELKLFEISPKVKGKVLGISQSQVEFVPESPLKHDTEYRVSFQLKNLFEKVPSDLEVFNFSVKTMSQMYSISPLGLQSYNENLYFLNAELVANDLITDETAKGLISAKVGNKKISVKVQPQGKSNRFPVIFDSIPRGADEQTLSVTWNAPENLTTPFSYSIPQKDRLEVVSVIVPEDADKYFEIVFSEPLDKTQNFNGLVSLSNINTELKFKVDGNTLKVYRDEDVGGTQELTVYQGIKSIYGRRTEKTTTHTVEFVQQKPEVRLVKSGTILPSSQNLKINFQSINLRAVNVSVSRIYQNNILQFLQENELNTNRSIYRVGKVIAKKVIQFNNNGTSLKRWNTHSLDLSHLITPEAGAIYRIEFSFNKNYSVYNCGGELPPLDLSFEQQSLNDDDADYSNQYDDEYGYYWESSENPCDDEYYYDKTVATNVLASDLGVIVKKGQNNHYTIVVNNILTTSPVSGATIELFDYQQQKIQEENTNSNGIANFNLSSRAFFAKIKKDDSTTYVKMDDATPQSVSKYDVDGMRLQKGLNGYIYAERGVWRPGDSIYVGFVLNDFAQKTPEKLPVKLKFTDPYGKVIAERMQSSNASNQYVFGLKTSPNAPTGNWNVTISAGAAKFHKQIKIETIKPNRLKIENNLNGKVISSDGENARLQVLWLHGSPAGNTQVNVKAKFYPMETAFKGYGNYIFNNRAYQFENQEVDVYEGKTDDNGKASFYFKTDELEAPGMLRVNFLTQANESGGDFSTDVCSASFSPYEDYVGLKLPATNKYDYYNTNENHTFEAVVLSEQGKPLRNKDVSVTLYKVGWNWWWDASNQNISTYNSSSSNAIYTTKEITTDSNGKATFSLRIPDADWGRYFVLLSNQDSGHKCGTTLYFDWGTWSGRSKKTSSDEAVMLALGSDKKEYGVGETAKISFPSDTGGRALISVENGSNVLENYWIETTSGETNYQIPITDKMAPNVYFYVTLLQPHANTVNDSPIRMYGILPVSVVDKNTKLEPIIQMADVLRPEQKTSIKISEKNGKPMTYTLAIVEDGLLNLTRFKTPNPWNTFFAKTALGVKTWDVYNDIIGAYGGTINQAFSIGGDEDLGGAEAQKANRFKPFVIFKGPFTLKGGSDTHEVFIPNYMGSARVMVVASDVAKNAFGSAEKKDIPVYSPVSILGSLPRKAVPNERITLPVTVFAMEKNIRNVSVSVETNGQFKVVSNKSQSVSFDSTGEKMAYFELETTQQLGIGKVKITATSGSEKATYEVEMDVYNPNPTTYVVENSVITAGQSANLKATLFGNKSHTVLEVSSFPGVNLHQRLSYLISYPHGCAEQITSGAFPQLFLGEFVNLTKEKTEEVRRNVTAAISKLYENQLSNGGFSYWKGSNYADDWTTSYIGQFFIEAEKRGYALPSGSKQNWLNFQNNQARQWKHEPSYQNDFAQAYRLYTLALAGSPNMGAMNRLRETNDISANAKRTLAAAYAIAGQKQTANKLFQAVSTDDSNAYYYGSVLRNKAMALETALLIGKKTEAGQWALEIADKLSSSDWLSTQTTAYSLYAIAKYVQVNKSGKSISATYTLNGKTENINVDEPMVSKSLAISTDKQAVSVKNNSQQTLYVRLISSGVLPVGKELAIQNGLSISITYRNKNGQTIDPSQIKQSTEFIASIEIKNLTNESVDNVALTQLIPSGWEIINMRFTDYGETQQSSYIDYTDFRDDRANFYLSLKGNESKTIRLKLNASYTGRYYLPGTYAEAMYNNRYNTRTEGKWVEVVRD